MRTIGEKFMGRLTDALADVCDGDLEMVRSNGSTDLLGRVDVILKNSVHKTVLQFTYHFGPHSWHPIVIHHSPEMNEDIQVFRWSRIDEALGKIVLHAIEQAPMMI